MQPSPDDYARGGVIQPRDHGDDGPHFFVFTFQRPRELGGKAKRVLLKYDPDVFS